MREKSSRDVILKNAWEIWQYLLTDGGLDPKFYDKQIVEDLCKNLGFGKKCDLNKELKSNNISSEEFIGAFLKSIEPYARMIHDLCVFFYKHKIKETNRSMKILFDFGKGPQDLDFDLEHFRKILWKYKQVKQKIVSYYLSIRDLWDIARVFQHWWNTVDFASPEVNLWLKKYRQGIFLDPYPVYQALVNQIDDDEFIYRYEPEFSFSKYNEWLFKKAFEDVIENGQRNAKKIQM